MTNALTLEQLRAAVHVLLTGDQAEQPAQEELIIGAALGALTPDEHHVIYDPENGDDYPVGWGALPQHTIASWSGQELSGAGYQELMGYGSIELLSTRAGNGLIVSVGGSSLSSAASFWIMPARYEGWAA